MNPNYQQGKQDVKDIKNKADETYQNLQNKGQQYSERAQGAMDQTKKEGEGLWTKTKNVATDVKDSIVEGASSAYESAKDLVSGTNVESRNIPSTQQTDVNRDINRDINREVNKNIVEKDLNRGQNLK